MSKKFYLTQKYVLTTISVFHKKNDFGTSNAGIGGYLAIIS